jgi:hypothetical protein
MKRSLPLSGDEIQFEKLLKLKSPFRKNKNKFGRFDSGGKTVSSSEKFSEKLGSSSKIENKNMLKFTKVAQNELLGLRFSEKMKGKVDRGKRNSFVGDNQAKSFLEEIKKNVDLKVSQSEEQKVLSSMSYDEESSCQVKHSGLSQVSISDLILGFLRFESFIKMTSQTKRETETETERETETDCLKRILCEMNSVIAWRGENRLLSSFFAELGTFALLQNQKVLAPDESLLRAARTGRLQKAAGSCRKIYDSCNSWEELTHTAELMWMPSLKK